MIPLDSQYRDYKAPSTTPSAKSVETLANDSSRFSENASLHFLVGKLCSIVRNWQCSDNFYMLLKPKLLLKILSKNSCSLTSYTCIVFPNLWPIVCMQLPLIILFFESLPADDRANKRKNKILYLRRKMRRNAHRDTACVYCDTSYFRLGLLKWRETEAVPINSESRFTRHSCSLRPTYQGIHVACLRERRNSVPSEVFDQRYPGRIVTRVRGDGT